MTALTHRPWPRRGEGDHDAFKPLLCSCRRLHVTAWTSAPLQEKPMNRSIRVAFVVAFLSFLAGRAAADSPLRLEAGATAAPTDDLLGAPGFVLGGAVALTRWAPSAKIAFVPQLELLFARRGASAPIDGADQGARTLDVLELPLLLRGELVIGGRTLFVTGGVHGSVLLRARIIDSSGRVESASASGSVDIGWIAGGGLTLASFASGELSVEMRYQRGYRGFLPGSQGSPEALSLLLGYGLRARGGEPSGARSMGRSLGRNPSQSLSLKGGLVATRLHLAEPGDSGYGPGFWFGGSYSPFRLGSSIALMPQVELSFVRRTATESGPGDGSLAMDSIDLAMLARGEVAAFGRTFYGLGGVYGSLLLGAQRSRDGRITDMGDTIPSVDAGWIAGAGIELWPGAAIEPAIELRYQRGFRNLLPMDAGEVNQQSVSCLVSITYGGSPTTRPRDPAADALHSSHDEGASKKPSTRRATSVTVGRPGDRWLDTMRFARIERATRGGQRGYEVTYNIAGHGRVVLFWPRQDIDFKSQLSGSTLQTMKLGKGRLRYPQKITRRSLPRVHKGILQIEAAYAKQADGATSALKGFILVAALGELKPRLLTIKPQAGPRATSNATPKPSNRPRPRPKSRKAAQRQSSNSAGTAATGGTAAARGTGQLHHAISKKIYRALEDHKNLAGHYKARDPRFVTRAVDGAAHRGYQRWHRDLDREVMAWIRDNKKATPAQFEAYLRSLYNRPELRARFPAGL